MISRLGRFAIRFIIAAAILWAILSVPIPLRNAQLLALIRVPIAVFIFIVYIGKTLFDTFFYERQP